MTSELPPWPCCQVVDYFYSDFRSLKAPFNSTVKAHLWARIEANKIIVRKEYEWEFECCRWPEYFIDPFLIAKTLRLNIYETFAVPLYINFEIAKNLK